MKSCTSRSSVATSSSSSFVFDLSMSNIEDSVSSSWGLPSRDFSSPTPLLEELEFLTSGPRFDESAEGWDITMQGRKLKERIK